MKTIDDLGLSVRLYNCLRRTDIRTVKDMAALSIEDVSSIRGVGKLSLKEFLANMSSLGYVYSSIYTDAPPVLSTEIPNNMTIDEYALLIKPSKPRNILKHYCYEHGLIMVKEEDPSTDQCTLMFLSTSPGKRRIRIKILPKGMRTMKSDPVEFEEEICEMLKRKLESKSLLSTMDSLMD